MSLGLVTSNFCFQLTFLFSVSLPPQTLCTSCCLQGAWHSGPSRVRQRADSGLSSAVSSSLWKQVSGGSLGLGLGSG